jgi:hypothetical protein
MQVNETQAHIKKIIKLRKKTYNMTTKKAAGISKIEYKILGSLNVHELPFVRDYADSEARMKETESGRMVNVALEFRITEKPENADIISTFLQSQNQHLLFRVSYNSGKDRVIGSNEFRPLVEMTQVTGATAGDYTGYLVSVSWQHPYVF